MGQSGRSVCPHTMMAASGMNPTSRVTPATWEGGFTRIIKGIAWLQIHGGVGGF